MIKRSYLSVKFTFVGISFLFFVICSLRYFRSEKHFTSDSSVGDYGKLGAVIYSNENSRLSDGEERALLSGKSLESKPLEHFSSRYKAIADSQELPRDKYDRKIRLIEELLNVYDAKEVLTNISMFAGPGKERNEFTMHLISLSQDAPQNLLDLIRNDIDDEEQYQYAYHGFLSSLNGLADPVSFFQQIKPSGDIETDEYVKKLVEFVSSKDPANSLSLEKGVEILEEVSNGAFKNKKLVWMLKQANIHRTDEVLNFIASETSLNDAQRKEVALSAFSIKARSGMNECFEQLSALHDLCPDIFDASLFRDTYLMFYKRDQSIVSGWREGSDSLSEDFSEFIGYFDFSVALNSDDYASAKAELDKLNGELSDTARVEWDTRIKDSLNSEVTKSPYETLQSFVSGTSNYPDEYLTNAVRLAFSNKDFAFNQWCDEYYSKCNVVQQQYIALGLALEASRIGDSAGEIGWLEQISDPLVLAEFEKSNR